MGMLQTVADPDTVDGGWENVEFFIDDAFLIAWDGCHKIYLAMDATEADWFRDEYPFVVEDTAQAMLAKLNAWYVNSCGLRFIQAVYHNEADPIAGFVRLLSQLAGDEDEDEEDDDE